jgi:hypothetical protein
MEVVFDQASSSALARARYDPLTRQLLVWFRDRDNPYLFFEVSQEVFNELVSSPSKGHYFNKFIRNCFRNIETNGVIDDLST